MTKRGLCLVGAALAVLAGCSGGDDKADETVGIGAVIDRTGSIARPAWHEAVKLAVRHANEGLKEHGGFRGLKFSYHGADSTNTPSVAVERAKELVFDDGVLALIADTSADDIAINTLNYSTDASVVLNVPVICQACTSGGINNPAYVNTADLINQSAQRNEDKWNFRSTMISRPQGVVLKNIAAEMSGYGPGFKISIYNIDDAYGNGFYNDIRNAVITTSSIIIEQVKHARDIDATTYNWAADAALLADNQTNSVTDKVPDLVIIVDFPQFASAITGAYETGNYTPRILQTHNFRHDTVVTALGGQVTGQEGTSHAILDNGASGDLFNTELASYQSSGAEAGFWDANTYDAAMTLMLATVRAVYDNDLEDAMDVTGRQIADSMFDINVKASSTEILSGPVEFAEAVAAIEAGGQIDYQGASGPMDFDADGNVFGKIARWVYQNNAFEDVDLYDCISDVAACPKIE